MRDWLRKSGEMDKVMNEEIHLAEKKRGPSDGEEFTQRGAKK